MREIVNGLQVIVTVLGAFVGGLIGGLDSLAYALLLFVAVDYITGIMAGIVEKKISSEVGFKGIFRKVVIFILVSIAHIIDSKILGNGSAIRTAVIFFYISNEGISILENAARIGLPIPQKLMEVLHQLNREDGINE
ncbi:phage holin family protein [Clostridium saudiense]|uniref:phage holin family protein n=1 Tax=Clostridium saudiense TaxID=1414720 RepID=UPI0005A7B678|nr:phage holin family protein [Clostridium saudiense]